MATALGTPKRIIEPFAGSACYSLHHHRRDVVLVERDPVIAELGADWLPFERVGVMHGQRGKSTEVAWFSDQRDRPSYRQLGLFGGDGR